MRLIVKTGNTWEVTTDREEARLRIVYLGQEIEWDKDSGRIRMTGLNNEIYYTGWTPRCTGCDRGTYGELTRQSASGTKITSPFCKHCFCNMTCHRDKGIWYREEEEEAWPFESTFTQLMLGGRIVAKGLTRDWRFVKSRHLIDREEKQTGPVWDGTGTGWEGSSNKIFRPSNEEKQDKSQGKVRSWRGCGKRQKRTDPSLSGWSRSRATFMGSKP